MTDGRLRFGFVVPGGDADAFARAAVACEAAGWDAVFTWESVWGPDAWVALTAAAERTSRIRLGTMLTPLPRVRPWELAARAASLDRLSGGRVQVAVGLGAPHDGWLAFEPDPGRRVRAEPARRGAGGVRRADARAAVRVHGSAPHGAPDVVRAAAPARAAAAGAGVGGRRVPRRRRGRRPRRPAVGRPRRAVRRRAAAAWCTVAGRRRATPERLTAVVERVRGVREGLGLTMDGYEVVVEAPWPGEDAVADASTDAWAAAGATFVTVGAWDLNGPDGVPGPDAEHEPAAPHRRRTAPLSHPLTAEMPPSGCPAPPGPPDVAARRDPEASGGGGGGGGRLLEGADQVAHRALGRLLVDPHRRTLRADRVDEAVDDPRGGRADRGAAVGGRPRGGLRRQVRGAHGGDDRRRLRLAEPAG
nr:LLM class flavin-dependent oxidoreductase [Angustibacter aerolatus]